MIPFSLNQLFTAYACVMCKDNISSHLILSRSVLILSFMITFNIFIILILSSKNISSRDCEA